MKKGSDHRRPHKNRDWIIGGEPTTSGHHGRIPVGDSRVVLKLDRNRVVGIGKNGTTMKVVKVNLCGKGGEG